VFPPRHLWHRHPAARTSPNSLLPISSAKPAPSESFHHPFTTLAKERPVGNAARERKHHLLERIVPAGRTRRTTAGAWRRDRQIRQNEPPDKASNCWSGENASSSDAAKRTVIHSGCRARFRASATLARSDRLEDPTRRGAISATSSRNVADATTDVEHPHSRSDASAAQDIRVKSRSTRPGIQGRNPLRVTECVGSAPVG